MIRIEIKVVIPINRTKDDFFKTILESSKDKDSSLWQTNLDIAEIERISLQAAAGPDNTPFLDNQKVLVISADFATKRQAQRVYELFKKMAISWEIEITGLVGKRIFSDLLDLDLEE